MDQGSASAAGIASYAVSGWQAPHAAAHPRGGAGVRRRALAQCIGNVGARQVDCHDVRPQRLLERSLPGARFIRFARQHHGGRRREQALERDEQRRLRPR
jgi:hypothetical protein